MVIAIKVAQLQPQVICLGIAIHIHPMRLLIINNM